MIHKIKKNRKLAFYWMQCAAMQDDTTALEDTRLKYRYLDLRRENL